MLQQERSLPVDQKAKILFIHHAAGWGGAPINMMNIIEELDEKKFDVEVLLLKDSIVSQKLKERGIRVSVAKSFFYRKLYRCLLHSEAGYEKWYRPFRFLRELASWVLSRYWFAERELSEHDFDIAHLNSSVLTDWLAPASVTGRVIIHIQEPLRKRKIDLLHAFLASQMRNHADRIIAISEDNARRVGIPEKTVVVYNFAEVPHSVPVSTSYSSQMVLYVGGAAEIKGFLTLVDALEYLRNDVKVLCLGSYATTNMSRMSIKEIAKTILFRGRKRKAAIAALEKHPAATMVGLTYQVGQYFDQVCCLVSPFAVPHFSRPIVEAYLHRKPVIASDVEGMDEIVQHQETGLIVPKNDPVALAAAINELTADAERAKRFGEAGYRLAMQKFTPENVRRVEQVYEEIVSDAGDSRDCI